MCTKIVSNSMSGISRYKTDISKFIVSGQLIQILTEKYNSSVYNCDHRTKCEIFFKSVIESLCSDKILPIREYFKLMLDIFHFGLWATPRSTQGLLMALCSETTPARLGIPRNKPRSTACKANVLPLKYYSRIMLDIKNILLPLVYKLRCI